MGRVSGRGERFMDFYDWFSVMFVILGDVLRQFMFLNVHLYTEAFSGTSPGRYITCPKVCFF